MGAKMNSAFSSIKQGLEEALEFSKGKTSKAVVHKFNAVDVKEIRSKIGMSQNEFASAFGISVSTLRHWERGDRSPHGPALVLLNVVAREPQAVLKALSA
jgi:putative transcriptional regulator